MKNKMVVILTVILIGIIGCFQEEKLDAPANVKGSYSKETNTVTIVWDEVSKAESYNVYQDGTLIKEKITDKLITLQNLEEGKEYKFEISAVRIDQESEKISVNIEVPETKLDKPILSSYNTKQNEVNIFWTKIQEAEGYKVYKDGKLVAETAELIYTFSDFLPGTSYLIEVLAFNNKKESSKASLTHKVEITLSTPSNLTVQNSTSEKLIIEWDNVDYAKGYKVYKNGVEFKNIETTKVEDIDLKSGNSYDYEIQAYYENIKSSNAMITVKKQPKSEVATTLSGTTKETTTYTAWDSKGRATKATSVKDDVSTTYEITYEGTTKTSVSRDKSGNIIETIVTTVDSNNKPIKVKITDTDGTFEMEYIRDSNGFITKEITPWGNSLRENTMTDGKLTKVVITDENTGNITDIITYEYNGSGRLKTENQFSSNEDLKIANPYLTINYTYDLGGDESENKEIGNSDEASQKIIYTYLITE